MMSRALLHSSRREVVKVEIPRDLYHAIVKIQAHENLDFSEAALKAASLIDPNSELFKQKVHDEALSLGKSQFLTQLNVGRQTIRAGAFKEAAEHVRRSEDNFHAPCSICGKPMHFSSRRSNWEKVRAALYDAFKEWCHTACEKKQAS